MVDALGYRRPKYVFVSLWGTSRRAVPVAITPFHLSCLHDMFVSHVEVSEVLGVFSQLKKVLFGVQMLHFFFTGGNSAS